MRQVDSNVLGTDPGAFYDMRMASPELIYILEDGRPTLVTMSDELFDSIRATMDIEEWVKHGPR